MEYDELRQLQQRSVVRTECAHILSESTNAGIEEGQMKVSMATFHFPVPFTYPTPREITQEMHG